MEYLMGLYLKNNMFLKILISIGVIFNYMAFYYNGRDIDKYHILFNIFILGISAVYIYLEKIIVTKREIQLFLLLWLPSSFLILLQFLYLHSLTLVKMDIIIAINILLAFLVNKVIGFSMYARLLRWMMLVNLLFIVFALFAGRIILDPSLANSYTTNLFLSIYGMEMAISPGSWGYEAVRMGGLFGHPNTYGIISMIAMIGLVFSNARLRVKILWWIVYCASFIVSESRASILFLFVFYILWRVISKRTFKGIFVNLVILLSFATFAFFLMNLRDDSVNADITSGRADLMEIVWNSIMTNPDSFQWFGVGIGQGGIFILRDVGLLLPIDNAYFLTALECGLIGGTFFILLWFFTWYHVRKYTSMPCYIYISFLVGILVYGLFEATLSMYTLKVSFHWIIFLFFMLTYEKHDGSNIKKANLDKFR